MRTREDFEKAGLNPDDCGRCQKVSIWVTCEEHEAYIKGFIAGFKYAESLEVPPVNAGTPTTIKLIPGTVQDN